MENKNLCTKCFKAPLCMGKCSCGGSHWGTVVYVWEEFDSECEFYQPDEKKGCSEFVEKKDGLCVMNSQKPFGKMNYKPGDIIEVDKSFLYMPKEVGQYNQLAVVEKIGIKDSDDEENDEVVVVKIIDVMKAQ